MAELAIATATLSLDLDGGGVDAAVLYEAIDVNISWEQEGLQTSPMSATVMGAFPGEASWSGSFSVLYDATAASTQNLDLYAPAKAIMVFALTDQTHTTPVVNTYTGNIVISGTSVNFNKTEAIVMEVTFLGDGPITPVIT